MYPIRNRLLPVMLAAVVACVAVACATGPRKTASERQADSETVDRVQAALSGDKNLYSRHIVVRADKGVVQLGGYVWTEPELEEAVRVAGRVDGVTKVVDRIEIDRGGISNSSVSR